MNFKKIHLFEDSFEVSADQASDLEGLKEKLVVMFSQQKVIAGQDSASNDLVEASVADVGEEGLRRGRDVTAEAKLEAVVPL